MKSISGPLTTLFATRQFSYATLFQFMLVDGTVLYYCGGDSDVSWGGHTYLSGGSVGPFFDRKDNKAKAHWIVGTQVDTLIFDVEPSAGTVEGTPFIQAIKNGVFDGAELVMSRAYWPIQPYTSLIVPTGVIANIFVGRVADVDCTRVGITFNVNTHLELLNQNMPVELYQSGCLNTLYGTACTLSQATYAVTGTLLTGSTTSSLNATLAQATGYFSLGKIKFTSGVNSGFWRGVKLFTNGSPSVIALTSPLPLAPSTGDTFTIYPGCDKQQATCNSKFSNLVNFRGMPYIPDVSTAV